MIGVDTNVLIRFLVRDDESQFKAAQTFLTERCTEDNPGFINRMVMCQLAWVLKRAYRCTRAEIADTIKKLAHTKEIVVEDQDELLQAILVCRSGDADFADAFLALTNRSRGCDTTATFDRKSGELPGMQLLGK